MRKNFGSGDLDPQSETLFRMLIERYDRAIKFPVGAEKFDIDPNGNIITYTPKSGFWNQFFGRQTESSLWFFDVCADIKDSMLRDPNIRNEGAKKKLEERLMSAFRSKDKPSLINWLFAVTLNLISDNNGNDKNKNNNNNNNGNNGNNKDGNNDTNKQDPPKRSKSQSDGSDYGYGRIGIPFNPYNYHPYDPHRTTIRTNSAQAQRNQPQYLILPEGQIINYGEDDGNQIVEIIVTQDE